jgi:plastocyanin
MTSRNTLLASALGLAFLAGALGSGKAAVAQGFGTIKGRVVWGGSALPEAALKVKKGDPAAKDAGACAKEDIPSEDYVVDPATKGVANAFAYVTTPKGANPEAEKALTAKAAEVEVDQKGCRFIPHALAFHKDQALKFKSSDPVGHNIRYTSFSVGALNQMLAPNGKMSVDFPGAEKNPVNLVCDIHPWMSGAFMVFDHPFFAISKADGSFEIKGVPAGTQQVIVRQEKSGFVTPGARKGVTVEVKADGVTDMGEIKLVPKD